MPADSPHQREKAREYDWWTIVGFLGAFLLLIATGIGYINREIDARKQAAVNAYLETGISQP